MNTPWHNECPLTCEQIAAILTRQFRTLAAIKVCALGEGWDNTTWQVHHQWLFRFPKHQAAAYLLQNELRLLPALQNLPLRIPKPQWMGQPDVLFPYHFYGHAFLEGKTVDRYALNRVEHDLLAKPIGRFLKALHDFPLQQAIAIGATHRVEPIFSLDRVQASFHYLIKHQVLASPEPCLSFFEIKHATELEPLIVLAHGDFYARHLLLDESKRLTGVIDWGDSVLCHPAIDLAIAYQMFSLEALNDFFEAYGLVSNNTKLLAKLRAIYSAVSMAWYAHQVQDEFLLQEGLYSLKTIQEHLPHEV